MRFGNDLGPHLEAYETSIRFKSQKFTSMHKIQKQTCNPRSTETTNDDDDDDGAGAGDGGGDHSHARGYTRSHHVQLPLCLQ